MIEANQTCWQQWNLVWGSSGSPKIEAKQFEIRDRSTFFAAVGIPVDGSTYLARRSGYGERLILFGRLGGGTFRFDPNDWSCHESPRTFPVAHDYIAENWNTLVSGDVIDVEYILGETTEKKLSEELTT